MATPETLLNAARGRLPNWVRARAFSDDKLTQMRAIAGRESELRDVLIGTNGSFARREASAESDLDFFAICPNAEQVESTKKILNAIAPDLLKLAGKPPAKGGAFGDVDDLESMLRNIGGDDDHNKKITRRVLLLLEGDWLCNEPLLQRCRSELLQRYIRPSITSHQLALFLLNDIIRYYRTMCVDFEFKTIESDKPWGTRNIKLVFSRKLLYFSGVLAVAETMQRSYEEKMRVILDLLSMPVIERVIAVCGDRAFHALELYDFFMGEFAKREVRAALDNTTEEDRTHEPFRRLKDDGHHFSWRLMSLFKDTYDISHPIHRLIFL
jgi:hypothetical protein